MKNERGFLRSGERLEDGIGKRSTRRGVLAADQSPVTVVPPRVEYRLTTLGGTLAEAFCGVWEWAIAHQQEVERARRAFDATRNTRAATGLVRARR